MPRCLRDLLSEQTLILLLLQLLAQLLLLLHFGEILGGSMLELLVGVLVNVGLLARLVVLIGHNCSILRHTQRLETQLGAQAA